MQLKNLMALGVLGVAATAATSRAADPAVYASGIVGGVSTGQTAQVLTNFHTSGDTVIGVGDDYSTGFATVNLTGLKFFGSMQNAADSLAIQFYDTTGALQATITPATSEVLGSGAVQTLAAADFGSGVTIPGNGYIIFKPTAASATEHFDLGVGAAPTVGTNDPNNGAELTSTGAITTGRYYFGFGSIGQYVQFELDGTGTGSVPEPASLGLLASGGLLLLRRRHKA